LGVCSDKKSISGIFSDLIGHVTEKYGLRAVVLVDEYDKPILDNIDHPEIAAEMRDGLKNLYSVLKEQDANLQFVFLTGVSKSSKVSLFSGLNQLEDLTLDARYSSICGYTHDDLRRSFSEHLAGVDWDKLKRWYDGYKWLGDTSVYNPYDVLLFISKGQSYRNYWFETGSPSFLVELFRRKAYFLPDLENVKVTEEILDSFDIENINPLTLLFQTGYLTVAEAVTQRERLMFQLRIPNFEVKTALSDQLINGYTELVNEKIAIQDQLYACFKDADMAGIRCVIGRLFAGIPYRNFTNNELLRSEGYYASVLYAFFCSLNAEIIPEDVTSHGQVDLTIKLESKIYVMEIKVVDTAEVEGNPALDQIKRRGYSEKYNGSPNRDVYQVGLIFSCSTRNLIKFDGLEI
ncbi:MAG: hypothetical protein EOL87_18890, partial [Spartobacteria bacterium]|nr:hypothetical protein [Spartobacteria bacterium]